jgi:hypothetical protein
VAGDASLVRLVNYRVGPFGRRTPPVVHVTEEVRTILSAAKRVGQALSEMNALQLAVHLNVRF